MIVGIEIRKYFDINIKEKEGNNMTLEKFLEKLENSKTTVGSISNDKKGGGGKCGNNKVSSANTGCC